MKSGKLFVVSLKHTYVSETDIESCRKNPVNFCISYSLKLYFDFLYLLCVAPFRLVWDKNTHSFFIQGSHPQKLLCVLNAVLFYVWYFFSLRYGYPNNPKSSNQIFKFLNDAFFFAYKVNFSILLWFNRFQIQKLVNFILQIKFSILSSFVQNLFFHKGFHIFLFVIQFALVLVSIIAGFGVFPKSVQVTQLSFDAWVNLLLTRTRFTLFLVDFDQSNQISDNKAAWNASDYVLFVFGLVGFFYRRFYGIFSEYYLTFMCAVMWCSTSTFAKFTRHQCKSWPDLRQNYKILCSLAVHVNQSISFLAFWWLTGTLFFYSLNVDIIFLNKGTNGNKSLYQMSVTVYWLVVNLLTCIACGQACSNVRFMYLLHSHMLLN